MKHLYLIRHAKSDWSDHSIEDHERPLNDRGLRDAPFMAKLLKEKINNIDVLYSSPANRALTTCRHFAEAFGIDKKEIIIDDDLYLSGYHSALQVIRNISEKYKNALLFFHNPDITELASFLSGRYIDNIPTCGIAGLDFKGTKWSDIDYKKCELVLFEVPKKYFRS